MIIIILLKLLEFFILYYFSFCSIEQLNFNLNRNF